MEGVTREAWAEHALERAAAEDDGDDGEVTHAREDAESACHEKNRRRTRVRAPREPFRSLGRRLELVPAVVGSARDF